MNRGLKVAIRHTPHLVDMRVTTQDPMNRGLKVFSILRHLDFSLRNNARPDEQGTESSGSGLSLGIVSNVTTLDPMNRGLNEH